MTKCKTCNSFGNYQEKSICRICETRLKCVKKTDSNSNLIKLYKFGCKRIHWEGEFYNSGYDDDDEKNWHYLEKDHATITAGLIGNYFIYYVMITKPDFIFNVDNLFDKKIETFKTRFQATLYLMLNDKREVSTSKVYRTKGTCKKWVTDEIKRFEESDEAKLYWKKFLSIDNRKAIVKKTTKYEWVATTWHDLNSNFLKSLDIGTYLIYEKSKYGKNEGKYYWSYAEVRGSGFSSGGGPKNPPVEAILAIEGFNEELDRQIAEIKFLQSKNKTIFLNRNTFSNKIIEEKYAVNC
jgi:hypothetical protein